MTKSKYHTKQLFSYQVGLCMYIYYLTHSDVDMDLKEDCKSLQCWDIVNCLFSTSFENFSKHFGLHDNTIWRLYYIWIQMTVFYIVKHCPYLDLGRCVLIPCPPQLTTSIATPGVHLSTAGHCHNVMAASTQLHNSFITHWSYAAWLKPGSTEFRFTLKVIFNQFYTQVNLQTQLHVTHTYVVRKATKLSDYSPIFWKQQLIQRKILLIFSPV